MLRDIFGATFVALVAAFTVVSIVLLIDATNTLMQASTGLDDPYFADITDPCDARQIVMCR